MSRENASPLTAVAWDTLLAELDKWASNARTATFWLRDDDAREPTPALKRLLSLGKLFGVPLGLAVIPDSCHRSLPALLKGRAGVSVLQHGFAHRNQAPAGEKKAEYGDHRVTAVMLGELARGHILLSDLFSDQFLHVLVPPWNRISDSLVEMLPSVGLNGLSTYQSRARREPAHGVVQSNCHADLINWRGNRAFIGDNIVLEQITSHLSQRRQGNVDDEATGVLTHHLDHDDECWRFLGCLFECTAGHPATRWLRVPEVMWNR